MVFCTTVLTIARNFAWEQGVNDMYSEEATCIIEILGKRLVVVVNRAENGYSVLVKVENRRRSQNLLPLLKIKFFRYISGKYFLNKISLGPQVGLNRHME